MKLRVALMVTCLFMVNWAGHEPDDRLAAARA
jgi:hypothetical protein